MQTFYFILFLCFSLKKKDDDTEEGHFPLCLGGFQLVWQRGQGRASKADERLEIPAKKRYFCRVFGVRKVNCQKLQQIELQRAIVGSNDLDDFLWGECSVTT